MSTPLHLNLIARQNGVGLDRDVKLVKTVAESAGHRVTVSHARGISPLRAIFPNQPRFDANIFMERVFTRWISSAKTNILIPNQERYPERHLPRLTKIDHIFCKTQHALDIFQNHHSSCQLTHFTSHDLFDPDTPRNELGFFHLAGRSTLKGTSTLLSLWEKHPEWSTLTLLQHKDNAPEQTPKNVTLITDYLSDEQVRQLANEHRFHLCPSESEGWGHYIVEAMSCQACVITTDSPPMNELVTPERGLLVAENRSEKRHLGINYFVDPTALEAQIEAALKMSDSQKVALGEAARTWMLDNDKQFRAGLIKTIETVLTPPLAQK